MLVYIFAERISHVHIKLVGTAEGKRKKIIIQKQIYVNEKICKIGCNIM